MVKYFRVKVKMAVDKCVATNHEDGKDVLVSAFVVTLWANSSSVPRIISSAAFAFLCVVSIYKGIT